jgi:hypothetical protein
MQPLEINTKQQREAMAKHSDNRLSIALGERRYKHDSLVRVARGIADRLDLAPTIKFGQCEKHLTKMSIEEGEDLCIGAERSMLLCKRQVLAIQGKYSGQGTFRMGE